MHIYIHVYIYIYVHTLHLIISGHLVLEHCDLLCCVELDHLLLDRSLLGNCVAGHLELLVQWGRIWPSLGPIGNIYSDITPRNLLAQIYPKMHSGTLFDETKMKI